jgi:hypothetical protein
VAEGLDRRGLLLMGAGLVLAGCTSRTDSTGATAKPRTPAARPQRTASTPGLSAVPLPAVTPWHPDPGDIEPAVKLAAVRHVERHGNGPRAALQVVDAQYGGLLPDRASVLVVCRQWHARPDGSLRAGGATYDVRVQHAGSGWLVIAVHPSRPGPPSRHPSAAARRVLANPRVDLPPASLADVRSGRVHDSVLSAMLRLAATYRIGVSVVRSGHPRFVFGTTRLSDHPRGRAFDTWRIDGRMVVDPATPRRLVTGYMEAAAAAGSYNVGGPYLLGAAPEFFSDATHHDHVHAGFDF